LKINIFISVYDGQIISVFVIVIITDISLSVTGLGSWSLSLTDWYLDYAQPFHKIS